MTMEMKSESREALLLCREAFKELDKGFEAGVEIHKAEEAIENALAEPIRNCDVGLEVDQVLRFREFCNRHKERVNGMVRCQKDCPARGYIEEIGVPYCQLKWAQMPYEETDGEQNENQKN